MKLYLIKADWRYEEDLIIVGISDAEHIKAVKEAYIKRHEPVADSILGFDIEEYVLNEAY